MLMLSYLETLLFAAIILRVWSHLAGLDFHQLVLLLDCMQVLFCTICLRVCASLSYLDRQQLILVVGAGAIRHEFSLPYSCESAQAFLVLASAARAEVGIPCSTCFCCHQLLFVEIYQIPTFSISSCCWLPCSISFQVSCLDVQLLILLPRSISFCCHRLTCL